MISVQAARHDYDDGDYFILSYYTSWPNIIISFVASASASRIHWIVSDSKFGPVIDRS